MRPSRKHARAIAGVWLAHLRALREARTARVMQYLKSRRALAEARMLARTRQAAPDVLRDAEQALADHYRERVAWRDMLQHETQIRAKIDRSFTRDQCAQ